MKHVLALGALVAGLGQAAFANEIFASQPKTVVTTIQQLGYRASLVDNPDGPRIDSAIAGFNYSIYFYGCTDGADCRFLEFSASFTVDPPATVDTVSAWNRDNLFGTAYLGSDGAPNISYTITTVGGLTSENFTDVIARWEVTLNSFAGAIGY